MILLWGDFLRSECFFYIIKYVRCIDDLCNLNSFKFYLVVFRLNRFVYCIEEKYDRSYEKIEMGMGC